MFSFYTSVVIVFLALSALGLCLVLRGFVDRKSIRGTPSISAEDAILTSRVSMIIHGSMNEVFGAITNYKDYSWSTTAEYWWARTTSDGAPEVGSPGHAEVKIEDFISRTFKITLTCLDRESKMIAECSTDYPSWLLQTERVHKVLPVQGRKGLCEYQSWVTYRGAAAYFLLFTADKELAAMQRKFAEDLKTFVEGRKR